MARTVETKYETDSGTIVRIRVGESAAGQAKNTAPAGAVSDRALFAFSSNPGSKRKKELNARGLILGRDVGTAPDQFVRRTFMPVLTPTAFDSYAIGEAVTIDAIAYTVRDFVNEA